MAQGLLEQMGLMPDWMARVRPILDQFAADTPGSLVEVKSASVARHYRGAPREFGARQAHERSDEELFRALPPSSLTVAVGRPWTSARFRLEDHRAVRRVLRTLVADADSGASGLRPAEVRECLSA